MEGEQRDLIIAGKKWIGHRPTCLLENFFVIFASPKGKINIDGRLAEWLGSGLQNRVRRFESATDLNPSKRYSVN